MEKSQLMETPSRVMLTNSSDELTPSNSDASSLTIDDSKYSFRPSENASPDNSMEWTNEKHNLYLNHLEASFIKQLHQSLGISAKNILTKQLPNVITEQMNFGKRSVISMKDDHVEGSGQNFSDNSRFQNKKLKIAEANESSDDDNQIVPSGKIFQQDSIALKDVKDPVYDRDD